VAAMPVQSSRLKTKKKWRSCCPHAQEHSWFWRLYLLILLGKRQKIYPDFETVCIDLIHANGAKKLE
jgi:hypothetical protein